LALRGAVQRGVEGLVEDATGLTDGEHPGWEPFMVRSGERSHRAAVPFGLALQRAFLIGGDAAQVVGERSDTVVPLEGLAIELRCGNEARAQGIEGTWAYGSTARGADLGSPEKSCERAPRARGTFVAGDGEADVSEVHAAQCGGTRHSVAPCGGTCDHAISACDDAGEEGVFGQREMPKLLAEGAPTCFEQCGFVGVRT